MESEAAALAALYQVGQLESEAATLAALYQLAEALDHMNRGLPSHHTVTHFARSAELVNVARNVAVGIGLARFFTAMKGTE